jgi:hypothetical protein
MLINRRILITVIAGKAILRQAILCMVQPPIRTWGIRRARTPDRNTPTVSPSRICELAKKIRAIPNPAIKGPPMPISACADQWHLIKPPSTVSPQALNKNCGPSAKQPENNFAAA